MYGWTVGWLDRRIGGGLICYKINEVDGHIYRYTECHAVLSNKY